MGEFTCEVYLDTMPITSSNFLDLVRHPAPISVLSCMRLLLKGFREKARGERLPRRDPEETPFRVSPDRLATLAAHLRHRWMG